MKRLLFIVLALLILGAASTEAKPKKLSPTITWELQKDGTLVIKGTGEMPDFEAGKAPWTKKAEKITNINIDEGIVRIGKNCFVDYKKCEYIINTLTIPSTMTHISEDAIRCSSIKLVQLAEGISSINAWAFKLCGLESIYIPNSVVEIEKDALYGCKGELIINSKMVEIDHDHGYNPMYSWLHGSNFTKLTIGNSVAKIGDCAFYKCESLTSITIGNSVKKIGISAFEGCGGLTSITIPNSVSWISGMAFEGCSALTSVTIPNSVSWIGLYAFEGCSSLTSVTIPNSVTEIGISAFEGCINLTSVTIPNSVTKIGHHAFYGCKSLTSVTIPNSVTKIGHHAFYGCKSLTSVTIPNSVTTIGESAFLGCSNLSSVNIPNSVVEIGKDALSGCSGELIIDSKIIETDYDYDSRPIKSWLYGSNFTKLTIGNNVTKVGINALRDCNTLTSVTIPKSVTKIGNYAFDCCTNLTSVTIPNSVTKIGKYAFCGCKSLTSVTIPNSVTSIEYAAFYCCYKLASIIIPNSVTEIECAAFSSCKSLTSVTIPNSVTSIKGNPFSGCSSLKTFYGKYASSDNRCLIVNTELISFAPAGLTRYTIPNSVTKIGMWAFENCSSLTSVTIPNSVTAIGSGAFFHFSSLASITIPDSVTSIGEKAFYECTNLASITIPDSVTSIGEKTFYECTNLASITIPDSVTSIGKEAFYGCTNLATINIPNSVNYIGENAFRVSKKKEYNARITNLPACVTIANCSKLGISEKAYRCYSPSSADCYQKALYLSCRFNDNEKVAFEYYLKGTEAWDEHNYKKLCYAKVGDYYRKIKTIRNLQTALQFYMKAKELGYDCDSTIEHINYDIDKMDLKDKAETALENKRYDLAWDYYTQYHKKYGLFGEYNLLNTLPDYFIERNDYTNAIKYYKKFYAMSIDSHTDAYKIAKKITESYLKLNNHTGAIEWYKKQYALNNQQSTAYNIANLYIKIKNYTQAIEWSKKGGKSDMDIADLYLKINNHTKAIEMLSNKAAEGNKDYQYKLAQVYAKSGNKNKAIFWYKKAAEQKHLRAEEALADYGIFLTQQQEKKVNSTPTHSPTPAHIPQSTTTQYRQVWVDCQQCNGGRCTRCDGYGNSYSTGGRWHDCVFCTHGKCNFCEGRGGRYETRMY